ncbi:MAG: DUF433 domain-containing protein [Chloroflexi bacterium]|nr:DUF433 domain-containing protein [Chloroflexota bacterium]
MGKREELLARIAVAPNICFGKPCIKGHRIWVSLVLDFLASGWTAQDILNNYPGLEEADILACIAYGAEMARERYVDIPPLLFRPSAYHGIAVLRLPPRATPDDLHDTVRTLTGGLERESIEGKLWIVQRGRIRKSRRGTTMASAPYIPWHQKEEWQCCR